MMAEAAKKFAEKALRQVQMILHHWNLLIGTIQIQKSVSFEHADFPLEFLDTTNKFES